MVSAAGSAALPSTAAGPVVDHVLRTLANSAETLRAAPTAAQNRHLKFNPMDVGLIPLYYEINHGK